MRLQQITVKLPERYAHAKSKRLRKKWAKMYGSIQYKFVDVPPGNASQPQ